MAKAKVKCDCIIEKLLKTPFKTMKLEEKYKCFEMDRPRPKLNLSQEAKKGKISYTRHFNVKYYKTVPWLCGCRLKNSTFCWVCLLFARDENVWNRGGYKDLGNFVKNVKSHSVSAMHLLALKDMKKFSKCFTKQSKSSHYVGETERILIELHNTKVEKEREILTRLVKVVSVLLKLGYEFNDSDLEKTSVECDQYMEIIKLIATYDTDLKNLLIEKKENLQLQFQQISSAISASMLNEVKREIFDSDFVMLIFDSFVDASSSKPYLATTLRYLKKNGQLVERFLYFTEWPKLLESSEVLLHILNVLKEFDCHSKLAGYAYDGALILPDKHTELKEKIRKENHAIFIPYYGHNLSYVFMQVINTIPIVRTFFASLAMIGKFFTKPVVYKIMEFEIKKKQPNLDAAFYFKWNDPIRRVELVFNNKAYMTAVLSKIFRKPEEYDGDIVTHAASLLVIMRDFDFNFFLVALSPVFFRCDILFRILQTKLSDPVFCSNKIKEFQQFLLKLTENFSSVWMSMTQGDKSFFSVQFNTMHKLRESNFISKEFYEKSYKEIFNLLSRTFIDRFGDLSNQTFLCLLNQKQFQKHRVQFPSLESLADNFLSTFHPELLKNELVAIYSDLEFVSVPDLRVYLVHNELEDVFPQTLKLSKLIATLPVEKQVTTVSERIRTYVETGRNLNNSSSFIIEREFLDELLEQKRFIAEIIDEYAEKANRADLCFKGLSKDSNLTTTELPTAPGLDPNLFTNDINIDDMEQDSETDQDFSETDYACNESITCITFSGNDVGQQNSSIKVKQEPKYAPAIPECLNIVTEENSSSVTEVDSILFKHLTNTKPQESSSEVKSLFQPPVLIKQEIVISEDES